MYMRDPNTGAHIAQMIGTLASFDKVQAMLRLLATTLYFLAIISCHAPLLSQLHKWGGLSESNAPQLYAIICFAVHTVVLQ